ncbi:MAG: hypothetical protein HY319_20525 [Armatimonadetes bacterium]|nr:hypothetical protein [Armatimonadota bacterium]
MIAHNSHSNLGELRDLARSLTHQFKELREQVRELDGTGRDYDRREGRVYAKLDDNSTLHGDLSADGHYDRVSWSGPPSNNGSAVGQRFEGGPDSFQATDNETNGKDYDQYVFEVIDGNIRNLHHHKRDWR